ncbi:hypothetical protein PCL_00432 [Purpureocillium lilacinum]|uniref:Uncharacterized protein n=1 Tax=Purpureocillium lilacinum TaxID=33203 RepID=A0A2U3DP52_PURLI|nr:hypothetical protein PCL_00432 [Purpureocillium lilacinum]
MEGQQHDTYTYPGSTSASPTPAPRSLESYSQLMHTLATRQMQSALAAARANSDTSMLSTNSSSTSFRTPDVVLLLTAIARRRDRIHRGEALDDDEQPLTWTCLSYLTMIWSEAYWMEPGQIVRRCNGVESRHRARDSYIKQQDAEAQLVAAGVFEWRRAFWYLIKTLERVASHKDNTVASGDDTAEVLLQADFHIPAVACWIKHNGRKLYDEIVKDKLKLWEEKDVPVEARHFDHPTERWSFWAGRLSEFARDQPDDFVKGAACHAVENMEAIAGASRRYNARHDGGDETCIICPTMKDDPRVD